MDRKPIILPTVDGDSLRDIVATAEYLGISLSAINKRLYGKRHPKTPFPAPVRNAHRHLTVKANASYAELLRRAGGHGEPIKLWLQSELTKYLSTQ